MLEESALLLLDLEAVARLHPERVHLEGVGLAVRAVAAEAEGGELPAAVDALDQFLRKVEEVERVDQAEHVQPPRLAGPRPPFGNASFESLSRALPSAKSLERGGLERSVEVLVEAAGVLRERLIREEVDQPSLAQEVLYFPPISLLPRETPFFALFRFFCSLFLCLL